MKRTRAPEHVWGTPVLEEGMVVEHAREGRVRILEVTEDHGATIVHWEPL